MGFPIYAEVQIFLTLAVLPYRLDAAVSLFLDCFVTTNYLVLFSDIVRYVDNGAKKILQVSGILS